MRSADGLTLGGHRHFAAHEAHAGFFHLLGHTKALHPGGSRYTAQRFIFPFFMSKPPQAAFERPVFDFFLHSPFTFID